MKAIEANQAKTRFLATMSHELRTPLTRIQVAAELARRKAAGADEELDRISERGGVLGAMETGYQRGRIQEESLYYESKKHDGSLPIVGVNTCLPREGQEDEVHELELIRSTDAEKQAQISHVRMFQDMHSGSGADALMRLQAVARKRGNVFAELMETVKTNSLGQISGALYAVGGEYRRNM